MNKKLKFFNAGEIRKTERVCFAQNAVDVMSQALKKGRAEALKEIEEIIDNYKNSYCIDNDVKYLSKKEQAILENLKKLLAGLNKKAN